MSFRQLVRNLRTGEHHRLRLGQPGVYVVPAGQDILETGAAALVNPVDCTGAQGAGLARAVAIRYPHAARAYKRACGGFCGMQPGSVWEWIPDALIGSEADRALLFAATKNHWRGPSTLPWVLAALDGVKNAIINAELPSVAIPALGCGLGGLSWSDAVEAPTMATATELAAMGKRVLVYLPHERPRRHTGAEPT